MERRSSLTARGFFDGLSELVRKCIFRVLMAGPIPNHIAFIMDGNRRFAAKWNMAVSDGHRAGSASMMTILDYSYQLGVKYITVYAFSIENFKRKPVQVRQLMELVVDMTEELLEGSLLKVHGTRIYFIGNLGLLSERVRLTAQRAMKATAKNSQTALLICMAYTSCDEIVHAVRESCEEKLNDAKIVTGSLEDSSREKVEESTEDGRGGLAKLGIISATLREKATAEDLPAIKLADIERHMYMAVAPDPDMVIRSAGETRLSNFLLWQTAHSPLYSPDILWPEIGYWQLLWEISHYQRSYPYLQKIRKQD